VPRLTLSLFGLACTLAACGDSNPPPDAPGTPTHPSAPQMGSNGGPVLAAPEIVPIFFTGDDDMQAQLEAFLRAIPGSDYWHAVGSEYGVGDPTVLPSIVSPEPPPTTDDELQALLEAHAGPLETGPMHARGQLGWPAPDPNTVYVVFLPSGVTLTAGSDVSCKTFGGYHSETNQSRIVYALLPRCPTTGVPINAISPALSHELIEAATDPHPGTAPGWAGVDSDDLIWDFAPGGEVGDMCEYVAAAFQPLIGTYVVQRSWSNASAAAGHDPCVPALAQPYVTAAPNFADVQLDYPGGSATTRGIQISNGSSATVDLDLFSDAPTADWTVGVDDVAVVVQMMPAELSFTLDKTTGNDGDRIHLTIKRLKDGAGGGSELVVVSKVNNVTVSLWWGLVTN